MRRIRPLALAALTAGFALLLGFTPTTSVVEDPPTTEFEDSEGGQWTSHEGELDFLAAVDEQSDRVRVTEIGRSHEDRPLHLVTLGEPAPVTAAEAREQPTLLFVCTQHGNEPAPREACLMWLRDLAFTDDPTLTAQLERQTILFVPTANPDGREANSRGNANGTDINRDHLDFSTPEAAAIAAVVRDWEPDAAADLHEYGPAVPVLYDDDVLYLWPRNLNVDEMVRTQAKALAEDYVAGAAEDAGYSADEYGIYSVRDYHVTQTAGGPDEGISRNALGLRHVASILVETAVTQDPTNSPDELVDEASNRLRRVDGHVAAIDGSLLYMRDNGPAVAFVNEAAAARKAAEGRDQSAPVYFGGADNEEPDPEDVVDPPPCEYRIGPDVAGELAGMFDLHGIERHLRATGEVAVPMAQPAEPAIPLLLDGRGSRSVADGAPVLDCGGG